MNRTPKVTHLTYGSQPANNAKSSSDSPLTPDVWLLILELISICFFIS